ncbi:patatin-like phospholipase family protein [Thermovibrio sp.]
MKVGITLSGGFVKGVAHIGFLKALEYKGIAPSFVCGASAGAVVGALYCAGYSPDEILEIAEKTSWKDLVSPSFKGGLFKLDGLYKKLKELVGEIDIRELKIPFGLTVVNLKTLKTEFKREGPLPELVVASCCVSPIFTPWEVNGEFLIDGGTRNCLPAEMAKTFGVDINICSNLNTPTQEFSPHSTLDVLFRSVMASIIENQEKRSSYCDIIVNHTFKENPITFEKVKELVQEGFEITLKVLKESKLW